MGPDPIWAYFRLAVNKRLTRIWPRYFLTQLEEIFFWPERKKNDNFVILKEIVHTHTQTKDGWPDPSQVKNFWPGPIPALLLCLYLLQNISYDMTNIKITKVIIIF